MARSSLVSLPKLPTLIAVGPVPTRMSCDAANPPWPSPMQDGDGVAAEVDHGEIGRLVLVEVAADQIARGWRPTPIGGRVAEAAVAAAEEELHAAAVLAGDGEVGHARRGRSRRPPSAVRSPISLRRQTMPSKRPPPRPRSNVALSPSRLSVRASTCPVAVEVGEHGGLGAVADQIRIAGGELALLAAEQEGQACCGCGRAARDRRGRRR